MWPCIARRGRSAEVAPTDSEAPSGSDDNISAIDPSIRERLNAARENGLRLQRSVQRPLMVTSVVLFACGVAMRLFGYYERTILGEVLIQSAVPLIFASLFFAAASVMPTDKRTPYAVSVLIAILLIAVSNLPASSDQIIGMRACAKLGAHKGTSAVSCRKQWLPFAVHFVVQAVLFSGFALFLLFLCTRLRPRAMRKRMVSTLRLLMITLSVENVAYIVIHASLAGVTVPSSLPGDPTSLLAAHVFIYLLRVPVQLLVLHVLWLNRGAINVTQSWLAAHSQASFSAATVASLLGGRSPEQVHAQGRRSFRAVPLDVLKEEHLASSHPDPTLCDLATPCKMGECDAFISHSWSDDAAAKWAALQGWRVAFRTRNGREARVWIDRVCIDQVAIADAIPCLPVYISGCRKLLLLPGTTYYRRLWCCIELATFLEMGGDAERVEVVELEGAQGLSTMLDLRLAECSSPEDTDRLKATIEAGFGNLQDFSARLQAVIESALASREQLVPSAGVLAALTADLERSLAAGGSPWTTSKHRGASPSWRSGAVAAPWHSGIRSGPDWRSRTLSRVVPSLEFLSGGDRASQVATSLHTSPITQPRHSVSRMSHSCGATPATGYRSKAEKLPFSFANATATCTSQTCSSASASHGTIQVTTSAPQWYEAAGEDGEYDDGAEDEPPLFGSAC